MMETKVSQPKITKEHADQLLSKGLIKENTHKMLVQKFSSGGQVQTAPMTPATPEEKVSVGVPALDEVINDPKVMSAIQKPEAPAPEPKTYGQERFEFHKKIADMNLPGLSEAEREEKAMQAAIWDVDAKSGAEQKEAQSKLQESQSAVEAIRAENAKRMKLGLPLKALPETLADSSMKPSGVGEGEPTFTLEKASGAPSGEGSMKINQPQMPSGFEMIEEGIKQSAIAGAQQAAYEGKYVDSTIRNLKEIQEKNAKIEENRQTLIQNEMKKLDSAMAEIKTAKIDPERFWANKTTGQKIAAAVAVAFGGAEAAQIIQNAINRDIDAQKIAIQNKKDSFTAQRGLFQDMMARFGDERQAEAATRATYFQMAELQLKKAESQTRNQQARAGLAIEYGKLQLEKEKAYHEFQKAAATSQRFQQADQTTQGILSLPKDLQGKAFQELGEYNNIVSNMKRAKKVMADIAKIQTAGSRLSSPIQTSSLIAKAEADLFPIVKAIVGEKMTDGDAKILIKSQIPGFFDNKKTEQAKFKGLEDALKASIAGRTPILSGYGLIKNKEYDERPQ